MLEMIENIPALYSGFILFGISFLTYYFCAVVKTPQLVCADGPFRKFIEENVEIAKQKFWPTLWCFEARAQTIIGSLLRSSTLPDIEYRREILTLKDGGQVALDWADENCGEESSIVIILPGLTGTSQAEYIKCLVAAGKKAGIKCVVFNNRGMGGVELKTPKLYCGSKYEDLVEVVDHVRGLHPSAPLGATGISMGGLILGNYLAQQETFLTKKLKAAFIISVPWNLIEGAKSIEKPFFNLLLNKLLTEQLCAKFRKIHSTKEPNFFNLNIDNILNSKTIREFDSHFTSKHFGYKDVQHFYEEATIHNKLHKINVPVLCLSAADDPFQPLEAIPLQEASRSKNIALLVTTRGGHIGFLEGFWPVKGESYIGKLFSQYFTNIFLHNFDDTTPVL